jgi:transglutaminase-like putative cysteine protease
MSTATAPARLDRPTERRSDVRRTMLALLATALGVFPLNELFVDRGWMIDVWLAMLVVVGPAALLRRTRPASAGQIWIGVALLVPWLTLNFVRAHAVLGFLPFAGAWHDVGHLMTNLHRTTAHGVAPVHTTVAIRLALCALLGLIAALVDLVAVVGRRGALAGVPLLVSFTIAGAVPRHPVSWLWFVVAAAAFLILLALDSSDDLQRWGHYIPRSSRSRRQAAGAVSAQRIAVIAIIAAVVLPMFIPANSRNFVANLFHHGGGSNGTGFGESDVHSGSGTAGIDPFAALFGELNRNTTVSLLSVRVSSQNPKFLTKGHQPFYLRTNVLPVFTGNGWRPGPDSSGTGIDSTQFDSSPGTPFAPSNLTFSAQIIVHSLHSNPPVFATPTAMSGLPSSTKWSKQNQLLIDSTVSGGQVIQETVAQPAPTQAELNAATTSDQALNPWLKLPAISNFVRSLTAKVVRGKTTPYQRARAISDFFAAPRNDFTYSLDAPKGDSGDALTDFLKGRVGYCQQYAASMAVMLRLAGVPSRVVLGYAHDVPNATGSFTVTNLDAHAWVEAYFAGVGWVPFDPTPLSGISGHGANDLVWAPHNTKGGSGGGQTGPVVPKISSRPITRVPVQPGANPAAAPRTTSGGFPVFALVVLIVVAVLVAVLLVPAFVRWRRRRQRLHRARHGDTDALWTELSDTATDLGYVWSPARTPRQVAAWLGGTSHQADSSLATLTRAVEVARYAPEGERTGPDLVHDLAKIESGLRSRRTTGERLRATLWPASLDWSRVPIIGRWLPGSGFGHRH